MDMTKENIILKILNLTKGMLTKLNNKHHGY